MSSESEIIIDSSDDSAIVNENVQDINKKNMKDETDKNNDNINSKTENNIKNETNKNNVNETNNESEDDEISLSDSSYDEDEDDETEEDEEEDEEEEISISDSSSSSSSSDANEESNKDNSINVNDKVTNNNTSSSSQASNQQGKYIDLHVLPDSTSEFISAPVHASDSEFNSDSNPRLIISTKEQLEALDDQIDDLQANKTKQEADEIRKEFNKPFKLPNSSNYSKLSSDSVNNSSNSSNHDNSNIHDNHDNHNNQESDTETSSISVFDSVSEEDSILETAKDSIKGSDVIAHTTVNGIPTEVAISKSRSNQMSDEEIQSRVLHAAENRVKKMKNEAANMKEFSFPLSSMPKNSEQYIESMQLLLTPLFVPDACIKAESHYSSDDLEHKYITIDSFVKSITHIDGYSWKNMPNETMLHSFAETFLITKKMNKLFKFKFADTSDTNFRVADVTDGLFRFLELHLNDEDASIFEHRFVVCILGKMEILLNTERNIWLKSDMISVDDNVLTVFKPELDMMRRLQSEDVGCLGKSWKTFVSALFNLEGRKNMCFDIKLRTYDVLNKVLAVGYCYDHIGKDKKVEVSYVIEELIGNTLKMYSNAVVQSFFFAIRTLYIMARLISLYLHEIKKGEKNKDAEEIATNLKVIAGFALLTYEIKYQMWKETIKTPFKISGGEELSVQAQVFVNNFVICGGQYFLLKAIEKALPALAYDIAEMK